jgi:hypothetical protein
MKKPKDVTDLAARLTAGATTPLQVVASTTPRVTLKPEPKTTQASESAEATPKQKRGSSVSVFLRMPSDLHDRAAAIAIERTKQTGKGVTVQQVILEILEQSL